jgi:transposase-like protein
MQAY